MKILTKIFTKGEDMDKFIQEYLKEYTPAGYGTEVEIKFSQTYKEWQQNKLNYIVTIERFDTCD